MDNTGNEVDIIDKTLDRATLIAGSKTIDESMKELEINFLGSDRKLFSNSCTFTYYLIFSFNNKERTPNRTG